MTVLFADVRGFSDLAKQWRPPELVGMMNQFFQGATEVLLKHDACIDKFMGDQIMAVFGAPIPRPDHAARALQAAIEMQKGASALFHPEKGPLPLTIGIAIHTGMAIVGNVGSSRVKDFTAMGDTVNLAAHLQEHAGPGEVLVTKAVEAALPGPMAGGEQRQVVVKGEVSPVVVRAIRP